MERVPFLGREFRLLDRYELQAELTEVMEKTEHNSHLTPKLAACHKSFRHKRCHNSHDWAKPFNSCGIRLCPHCAHRRSEILAHRIQEFVLGRSGLRYAVLAERSTLDLAEGMKLLWQSWMRLRRSVCWKHKVRGCIVALEVTYNREEQTWHPHLNVLMEGEYFPFLELNLAWAEATEGRGKTSYIQAANEGTPYELIKYVLKVAEKDEETGEFTLLLEDPISLDEFLCAVKGRRLVRTYGTFRGIVMTDESQPDDGEECPDCGSKCIVDLGFVPAHQISFDFEKNCMRVKRPPGVREQIEASIGRLADEYFGASEAELKRVFPFRPRTVLEKELQRLNVLIADIAAKVSRV